MLKSSSVVVSPVTALPRGDFLEQAAHDLAAARLRQRLGEADFVRRGHRADDRARRASSTPRAIPASASTPCLSVTKQTTRLALEFIGPPDHRRLGHRGVRDQRALDFRRAEAMPGDVEHVVDAADDPEIAVLVAPRAVAGEIACP